MNIYTKDTTEGLKNQDVEILKDRNKNGKDVDWKEHKEKTLLLAESYKRLGMDKAYRVMQCGTYLEFKRFTKDNTLKLKQGNFCKVRLCPMCIWRRSRKIYGQVSKVMDKALEEKEYRFIFLTLTAKNCEGDDLKDELDNFFNAFKRMSNRKQFKTSIKGWFRGLEVTHNINEKSNSYDTYNPHFHLVLMVNKNYFKRAEYYISQDDWTKMWKQSLKVDYNPIVDIRTFKTSTKKDTAKSISESAKYTVKDNDFLIENDTEMTDRAVFDFEGSLSGRRLIAYGGKLKEIHKELNLDDVENGDLVNTDNEEELREDIDYIIEKYSWNIGYREYVKNT